MSRPEEAGKIPEYGKTPFSPYDLLQLFLLQQKPVNVEALRAIIEPLEGTSFGTMALKALKLEFHEHRLEPPPHTIMPAQLHVAFSKSIDHTNLDDILKGQEARHAEDALWTHITPNVAIESIYPDARLEPGEMAFYQHRYDNVWHDVEHFRHAFEYGSHQWQFFKDGERIGVGLSVNTASWINRAKKRYDLTILADGSPLGRQFYDPYMRGIAALPKELQTFDNYANLLLVSDKFDFSKALRRVL